MAAAAQPTPPDPTDELTPTQHQVIAMLAAGIRTRVITEEAKIHRNTIGNWRRTNPAFAEALADAQYERTLYWRDQAEDLADLAINAINNILQDAKAAPSVRLRAALAILQQATTLPPPAPETVMDPEAATDDVVQPTPPKKLHNSAQPPSSKPPRTTPSSSPNTTPKRTTPEANHAPHPLA